MKVDQPWGLGQLMRGLFFGEDIDQLAQLLFQSILEVVAGDCPVVGEEFYRVGYPGTACRRDVTLVVSVVLECWAYVVPAGSMLCPSPLLSCSVVDGYFAPWGSHWCGIVVKVPVDQGSLP